NQLRAGRSIDTVVTRTGNWVRGNPEMDFPSPGLTNHLDQTLGSGASDQGIIHHHDLLTRDDVMYRIELDPNLGDSAGLARIDERAPDVMIADQAILQLNAAGLGKPERHGVG